MVLRRSSPLALLTAAIAAPRQVTTPPVLAARTATLTLPTVLEAKLPNGLTILVSRNAEVPIVEGRLILDGGARMPDTPPGLASLTATVLTEGAGGRDARALNDAIEFLGARVTASGGWENFTLSLRAPKRNIDGAMGILADVVLRPTFASADVSRQRDLRIAALIRAKDQPGTVANLVFFRNVFPVGHPYHLELGGDSSSVAHIDSAAVRRLWNRATDPRRATLILTGDVTLAEATAWATKHFGGWTSPPTPTDAALARGKPSPRASVAAACRISQPRVITWSTSPAPRSRSSSSVARGSTAARPTIRALS